MLVKVYTIIIPLFSMLFTFVRPGFPQNTLPQAEVRPQQENVSILESKFSTTTPVIGDSFTYSLKFDHIENLNVYPVEHFVENGLSIIERKSLTPQEFEGRIIEQYEYTLRAEKEGQYQFSPVAIHHAGPLKNSVAALTDPIQLTVLSVVDVQVVTNSPIMIDEPLNLSLSITKRQPVTITSMPPELNARLQIPEKPEPEEQETTEDSQAGTPTPTAQPAVLRFTLDQSQNVVPQQADGQTIEQYQYIFSAAPEQAGEYLIPEFVVTYRTVTGEEAQKHVETTGIFVLNPNTANVDIQTDYRFLIGPAIIVATLILGGLAVFLYLNYRKPRRHQELIVEPVLPPGELAHRELAEIQTMKLPGKGEFKKYYILVSESVRKFLGAEYHFHVLERTTEEILDEIRQRDIPDRVRRQISTFLPEADMVKFAKYIPTIEEADTAMEQALKIVDESLEYHRPKVTIEESEAITQINEDTF